MSAEEDARARRDEWIAAGAPDYNAPTSDSGGNITGYVSVAAQPQSARSESNQSLQIVGNQVVDTATGQSGPYYPAKGTVTWINQPVQTVQQPIQQPVQQNPTPAQGDTLVTTCKGQMTRNFLHDQLYQAGYDGPWDSTSMVAAFNRAACPSIGDGSGSGDGAGGSGSSGGSGGGTSGGGSTDTGTGGNLGKASALGNLQGWIQSNPLPSIVIAAIAGSMLLGGRRR